jgi:hypothetical protein
MQKQDLFVEVRGHRYVVIEKRRQYQAIPERYGRKRDASAALNEWYLAARERSLFGVRLSKETRNRLVRATTNTEIRAIARELAAR